MAKQREECVEAFIVSKFVQLLTVPTVLQKKLPRTPCQQRQARHLVLRSSFPEHPGILALARELVKRRDGGLVYSILIPLMSCRM